VVQVEAEDVVAERTNFLTESSIEDDLQPRQKYADL